MKRSMEEHLSMYFHVYYITLLIDESIYIYHSKVAKNIFVSATKALTALWY